MIAYEQYTEYLVQRGETHKIVFKIESDPDGIVTGNEAVSCVGKFIGSTRAPVPDDDEPVAFTLTPEEAAAAIETKIIFAAKALREKDPIPDDYTNNIYWS